MGGKARRHGGNLPKKTPFSLETVRGIPTHVQLPFDFIWGLYMDL